MGVCAPARGTGDIGGGLDVSAGTEIRRVTAVDLAVGAAAALAILHLWQVAPRWGVVAIATVVAYVLIAPSDRRGDRPWEPLGSLGSEVPALACRPLPQGSRWRAWASPMMGFALGYALVLALLDGAPPTLGHERRATALGWILGIAVASAGWGTWWWRRPRHEYRLKSSELVVVDTDRVQRWPYRELAWLEHRACPHRFHWSDDRGRAHSLPFSREAAVLFEALCVRGGPAIAERLAQRIEAGERIAIVDPPFPRAFRPAWRAAMACGLVGFAGTMVAVTIAAVVASRARPDAIVTLVLACIPGIGAILAVVGLVREIRSVWSIGIVLDARGASGPSSSSAAVPWAEIDEVVQWPDLVELSNRQYRLCARTSVPYAWALSELVARMKRASALR